jgi:hypothetical protein
MIPRVDSYRAGEECLIPVFVMLFCMVCSMLISTLSTSSKTTLFQHSDWQEVSYEEFSSSKDSVQMYRGPRGEPHYHKKIR